VNPESDDEVAVQRARYHTAVRFNDDLVGEVLADLRRRDLLQDTVVLITADHGEEFGESSAKLTEHGSGYTRYQLVTPMILHWPGRGAAQAYDHRTSHYDIVPTLVQDLLGCSNPSEDYSVGRNLFELSAWPWMVAGSYFNYAVLEPDQVTITFPSGLYEVRDWDYRLLNKPAFRGDVLEAVSEQNSRYFAE
jgi:membrane-anchored protein YejM (alkaline phosphatase superfamily)